MARRKVTNRVPPITPVRSQRRAGTAWDEQFLGANRYTPPESPSGMPGANARRSFLDMRAIQVQAEQRADPRLYEELAEAAQGNDALLLPYQPTPTIDPKRPRTLAAGYDERTMTLRIKFRDGEYYTYYNIPPSVWYKFQRVSSPGRYINSALNSYPYTRGLQ